MAKAEVRLVTNVQITQYVHGHVRRVVSYSSAQATQSDVSKTGKMVSKILDRREIPTFFKGVERSEYKGGNKILKK